MMMYGDDNDLRAGRAIDDGIGEPTHQAASMFAMHLPEALGILTNCIHGRLYRLSELNAQPYDAFFIPAPSLEQLASRFWPKNNARRHPPRRNNSSFTLFQGMAELG